MANERTTRERYDWVEMLGAAIAARARTARHIADSDCEAQRAAIKSLQSAVNDKNEELGKLRGSVNNRRESV